MFTITQKSSFFALASLNRYDLCIPILYFSRIVGDNWDLNVKSRCQTKGQTNQSLHYFNEYAIKDRVPVPHHMNERLTSKLESLDISQFLPTDSVQDNIISSLTQIIPRVIVKYLGAYQEFRSLVVYHIEHPYSHEMQQKSEVVSVF